MKCLQCDCIMRVQEGEYGEFYLCPCCGKEIIKNKRKSFVEKVWIDEVRKLASNMISERNNAHHLTHELPASCIPSGMRSHGFSSNVDKVVIKDYYSQQCFVEEINKTLDLLLEHITYIKEDLREL